MWLLGIIQNGLIIQILYFEKFDWSQFHSDRWGWLFAGLALKFVAWLLKEAPGIAGGTGTDRLTKPTFQTYECDRNFSPQASTRLNRIKKVSRVLKVLLLLYFVCAGFFFPFGSQGARWMECGLGNIRNIFGCSAVFAKLIAVLAVGVFFAAVITGYRSCSTFTKKGIIFSARNVHLLGRVGCLALGYCFSHGVGSGAVFQPGMLWH